MTRLLIIPFLLIASSAYAQGNNTPANQSACSRDVSRFCRAKMNDGDMVVLACLKEHRSKLSKTCAKADVAISRNGMIKSRVMKWASLKIGYLILWRATKYAGMAQ